jgi:hypothetical protein
MGISSKSTVGSPVSDEPKPMTATGDSLLALVERIQKTDPSLLNLYTARTDAEFESAFDSWLERAVSGLERNKKNFATLTEEGLSGVLALALTTQGIVVTPEANSNGHVDLLIEVKWGTGERRKLGEAKIYDGPAYHIKGLQQLLRRYTTGREGRGLLIVYVKKADIAGLIRKLRDTMDETAPEQQKGKSKDYSMKWSFISVHGHSCGEDLEVGHIGCNLYCS